MHSKHLKLTAFLILLLPLSAGAQIPQPASRGLAVIHQGHKESGAKAQYDQAMLSIEGDDGEYPAKVLRGIELLRKSAAQGYAPAQFKLGYYYHTGPQSYDCLKQEPENAYYWYEKAAQQNYPEAQYELAMLFNPETGFKKFVDRDRYAYWMKKAAEAGYPKAQYWLGRMYEKGDSVQHDLRAAELWYQKAASQGEGYGPAIKALKRLSR